MDKIDSIWKEFSDNRTKSLYDRLKGWHRAIVVETNDPLRHHRIRFKLPAIHDSDLKPNECPWAVPSPTMGGKGCGGWSSVSIGDAVWINFENGHPYGPIWAGGADPSRRKFYSLESIYGETQVAVSAKGERADKPDDYLKDYMPKDERPMSTGIKDRYGNVWYMCSVGFFPKEHAKAAFPTGSDPVSKGEFDSSTKSPEENKPDVKYITTISKYGNYMILSDTGYKWKNEFDGDFDEDEDFEIKRWKYMQKLLSEDDPEGYDQRRIEMRTRFGHKFEMRDVGWKKSRSGEFEDQVELSDVDGKDEEEQIWVRMATKDGCYFRMWSKGADLEKNNYIKRLNKSDVGTKPYNDDKFGDGQGDARGIILCTPRQNMLALDDAGSDPKDPQNKEKPYPNGVYLGGWRDGRFFGLEANLKDEIQRWMMYTSNGHCLELNQKWDYIGLSTKPPQTVSREFDGPYKRIPWSLKTLKGLNVEKHCFHLILDHKNRYMRCKTPKGQGMEMRDGDSEDGCGGTWTEMRDSEDRGIWFSKDYKLGIWRDSTGEKYICINDDNDYILVRNNLKSIQIYARKDVEVIAGGNISMKAGGNIDMEAGGQVNIKGSEVKAGPILRTMDFYTDTMCGKHKEIQKPKHPIGFASPCGSNPSPSAPSAAYCNVKKPEDFDKERGCDPTKSQKGPIDPKVVHCSAGQGGSAGGGGADSMDENGNNLDVFNPSSGEDSGVVNNVTFGPPPPAPTVDDPIDKFNSSGVLWFGTSDKYLDQIDQNGIELLSLANPENDPPDKVAKFIPLAITTDRAEELADVVVQKYGGNKVVYRIVAVNDGELLQKDELDSELVQYSGDKISALYVEVFEIIE